MLRTRDSQLLIVELLPSRLYLVYGCAMVSVLYSNLRDLQKIIVLNIPSSILMRYFKSIAFPTSCITNNPSDQ